MDHWERIEAMARSVDLTGGLEARVADPLWLMARQWQVGEFHGDDAAQPAVARIKGRSVPLATFRAGRNGRPVPIPDDRPLETLAEATAEPAFGGARLHGSARAGRRLAHQLRAGGLAVAVDALRGEFKLTPPAHAVAAGGLDRGAAELLVRFGLDGAGLARANLERVTRALATVLRGADLDRATAIVDEWKTWYRGRGELGAQPGWDDERLEYTFSVAAAGPQGEITLRAPDHDGGHLDWYSFEVTTDADARHGLGAGTPPERVRTAVPTPVRYSGMPASRLWEFEDGAVHFGDLDAGPADLARLLVAEFATVYADDHFVVAVPVPVGSLTELRSVEVIDTFGGRTSVKSTALTDGAGRSWRLFELTGDEVGNEHPSPWLLIPPTLAGSLDGPVLDRIAFTRDEAANLAWGIEHLVEGSLGRGVDRAQAWHESQPAAPPPTAEAAAPGDWWRYRLEATAPPWWVPLLPELIDPGNSRAEPSAAAPVAQVRLRRARMQAWALLGAGQVGPKTQLLDPSRPRWLYEEQVPKAGVRVERAWQLGRWHDGSLHVWLRHRATPGRGESSGGVRWDLLDRKSGMPPARP